MADQDASHRRFAFGDHVLDVGREALSRAGVEIRLRPKSYAVLRYLVEHPGRLVGKDELLDAVWGRTVVTEGSLTQCIIEVRRALGDHEQRMIRTVARRGYIFEPEVDQPTHASDLVVDGGLSGGMPTGPARAASPDTRWWPIVALAALSSAALAWWALDRHDADGSDAAQATTFRPPPNSIAVLRFLDLSPDASQRYFADGLSEEILHLLAQSPDLRVTARGSSFAFEPGSADIAGIARQLDVAYVLDGSVRRAGDDLRVNAQLIDARTRSGVWSRSFDRRFEHVLDLQRDLATAVADALTVTLAPTRQPTAPGLAQAHDLFLHGRHLFHRRAPGDLEAAERYLEQAVALDPGHARAWTALAGTYAVRSMDELRDPAYRLAEQRRALERALEIDPDLPEALVRMGRYFSTVGDTAASQAAFDRARRVAPNAPLVLFFRSRQALLEGRLEESVALERQAVSLDPLSAVYRGNFGRTLMAAGRFEDALRELRRSEELSPLLDNGFDISRALLLMGRTTEAMRESASVREGPERDQLRVLLGAAQEAAAAHDRLLNDASVRNLILLAEIAAFRGDQQGAFAWLGAADQRIRAAGPQAPEAGERIEMQISPFLRPLHADPRWASLHADAG